MENCDTTPKPRPLRKKAELKTGEKDVSINVDKLVKLDKPISDQDQDQKINELVDKLMNSRVSKDCFTFGKYRGKPYTVLLQEENKSYARWLSNKPELLNTDLKEFLQTHFPKNNKELDLTGKMKFGKYKGTTFYDLPEEYILWLHKTINNPKSTFKITDQELLKFLDKV